MRKFKTILMAMVLSTLFSVAALAGGMGHAMPHGKMIHKSVVEGYQFMYHLIDVRDKMAAMKNMKGMQSMKMDMTHHLMVYIVGPDGKKVDSAMVGFLVEGPNQSKQKCMTMAMSGGFGADVNLKATGTYALKIKALVGKKKLVDSFDYNNR